MIKVWSLLNHLYLCISVHTYVYVCVCVSINIVIVNIACTNMATLTDDLCTVAQFVTGFAHSGLIHAFNISILDM